MRVQRTLSIVLASLLAGGVTYAQVGSRLVRMARRRRATRSARRGFGPTRRSRSRPMSKPGFELQWSSKLDNQTRGLAGLTQGVTASGVTLFVPTSLVGGQLQQRLPARQRHGLRGVAAQVRRRAAGRHRRLRRRHHGRRRRASSAHAPVPTPVPGARRPRRPRAAARCGYRSLLGEPGAGRAGRRRAGGAGRAARPGRRRRRPRRPRRGRQPRAARPRPVGEAGFARQGGARRWPGPRPGRGAPGIPGAPQAAVAADLAALRWSATWCRATACCTCVGLQSGKDLQQPARFLPGQRAVVERDRRGHHALRRHVGQLRRRARTGVWAIDLEAPPSRSSRTAPTAAASSAPSRCRPTATRSSPRSAPAR